MKSHVLAVIIPAFNEKGSIVSVISSLPRNIEGVIKTHVVVMDDGSNDGTSRILPKGVIVVRHIKKYYSSVCPATLGITTSISPST